MTIEIIALNYPTFFPVMVVTLGALYFNYVLIRNSSHFHWNIFMMAIGLLAVGFSLWLLTFFYPYDAVEIMVRAVVALSAVLFAISAYIATKSDKK